MGILNSFKNNIFNPQIDNKSSLPNEKGAYLICIKDIGKLPELMKKLEFSSIEGFNIIYLGISGTQGLRGRDYGNHFRGSGRNSMLRKSLGVLFGYGRHYFAYGKYRMLSDRLLPGQTARCHSFIYVKNFKFHIGKAMMKIIIAQKKMKVKLVKRLIANGSKHGFRVDGFLVKLST